MNLKGRNNWIHFGDINDKGHIFSKYVAVGNNGILAHSDNGTSFTKETYTINAWQSICYGNYKFVAVGANGKCSYSDDGIHFNAGDDIGTDTWNSICYGDGKFVIVSENGNYGFTDFDVHFVTNKIPDGGEFKSVCYGNDKFVAVGYGGALAYSNNGTTFDKKSIPGGNAWLSICYGNGKFVVVGNDGSLAHSDNGTNFTKEANTSDAWQSVCYGNGKFVAVSAGGKIAHSDDGTNFTPGNIEGTYIWQSICYGNGRFVAVSRTGTFAYSDNGIDFIKGEIAGGNTWFSVCYAEHDIIPHSGLTFYTNSSNYAHIFANGKDILPNIPSNPVQTSQTITHEAPYTSSIENYSLRKPVYATGTVKSFNKESSTWTNTITNIDCICELKPSGTPDEFVGILVAYVDQNGTYTQSSTNVRALLFATHGDFLFDVPSTENIKVGDLISINGESIPDHTILTAKINNIIIGRCTSIINSNTISILKD